MGDVLNPELAWIDGRFYRLNDSATGNMALEEHDLLKNEVPYMEEDNDDDDDVEIVMIDDNRCFTIIYVSKHYRGYIIGRQGSVKSRIESDTRTNIKIPRHGEDGDITIYGQSAASVKAAKRRIDMIVVSARSKQKCTHFVSIPLNHPDIVNSFDRFKEEVLSGYPSEGLEESLFISAQKLHVTVGITCLMDDKERLFASKLLTEANDNIIKPFLKSYLPLKIRIKGLSYMNDDPKQIHVLFARVEEVDAPKGLLQDLVDAILVHFHKAGFMKYERDSVNMHVTLINTRYRNPKDDENQSYRKQNRTAFDGSRILENFSNYDFGEAEINEFHLSNCGAVGPDGYYLSTCTVSCN